MYVDENCRDFWEEIQQRFLIVCSEVFVYFIIVNFESYWEVWISFLLLFLIKIFKINDEKFKVYVLMYYFYLCEIMQFDLIFEF